MRKSSRVYKYQCKTISKFQYHFHASPKERKCSNCIILFQMLMNFKVLHFVKVHAYMLGNNLLLTELCMMFIVFQTFLLCYCCYDWL